MCGVLRISGYKPFLLAPSISILELLWISFIQSPGVIWDGYSMGCYQSVLKFSGWDHHAFHGAALLSLSRTLEDRKSMTFSESDFISMKLIWDRWKGWLWMIERLWAMWIMHHNVFFLKLHMQYEIIFIFSSTFARDSGDIGRRLPKVRLSRFAVFLTLVVAGLKPLRYDSRCHGECHAVVVSSCSNKNFDPNVKDGDTETSWLPQTCHILHRLY